jgi:hypothetical protein
MNSTQRNAADKRLLEEVGKAVLSALSPRKAELGIQVRERAWRKPVKTHTGGWRVRLARFRNQNVHLEIWFDQFAGYDKRKCWFGSYSTNARKVKRISERWVKSPKPVNVSLDEVWRNVGSGVWQLRRRLTRVDFRRPSLENYDGRDSYFGFHLLLTGRPKTKPFHEVVERMIDFFQRMAGVMKRGRKPTPDVYSAYENRRVVRTHLARERDPELARRTKEKDGWRCQVCGMTFLEFYGEIGRDFAEAHHTVPLSKLRNRRQSTIDDLTTVCANCHRMLHKMDGKPNVTVR